MNFTKTQLIFIGIAGFIVIVFGLVFAGVLPGRPKKPPQAITATIEFWGVFDRASAYEDAINNFKTVYPEVTIKYLEFNDEENYKNALLDALASGKGPDVLMLKNSELPREINKIARAPDVKFNLLKLRQLFPKTVERDFVSGGGIYALPLSIDTLALIYNRDLLNQEGIAVLPETWEDFKLLIPRLVKIDQIKNLEMAGAAIGGSQKNIDSATDLLYALMLQTGTKMVSEDLKNAIFASKEGINAVEFYTGFADPKKPEYTWNETMPNSLDGISQGKVAMIFNYASSIRQIKSRSPFIDLGVAPFPQPKSAAQTLTYPNYWGYAVSQQSKNKNIAWDFIISLTNNPENAKKYLEETKRPPALLPILDQYANDPELSVFAKQALIARSWPQTDPKKIALVFSEMIENINPGKVKLGDAIKQAEKQVTEIMGRKTF